MKNDNNKKIHPFRVTVAKKYDQIWNRDPQITLETKFALVPMKNDNNKKFHPFRVTVEKI